MRQATSRQLLPYAAIATCLALGVWLWSSHLRIVTSWEQAFAPFTPLGDRCEYAQGLWSDGTTFDSVRAAPQALSPAKMPYRQSLPDLQLREGSYLYVRCAVDLSRLPASAYAWASLGPVFGDAAVYLDGVLRARVADDQAVEFPLLPAERRADHRLEIVAKARAGGFPGPASLVPMVAGADREAFARVRHELGSWRGEMPIVRLTHALSVLMLFASLWLLGRRFADVGWVLVLAGLLATVAFLEYAPVGARPLWVYRAMAVAWFGVILAMPLFVLAFLRLPLAQARVELGFAAAVGAFAVVAATLPFGPFFPAVTGTGPYLLGIALLAGTLVPGFRLQRRLTGKRRLHVRAMLAAVLAGIAAMTADAALNVATSLSLTPFVVHGLLTAFALFLVTDLVLFQRGFFDEKAKRQAEERKAATLSRSLEMGHAVQSLLLPKEMRAVAGPWKYAFHYESCERMAGDWVNVWRTPSGELRLLLGDVVGKGPRAAVAVAAVAAMVAESRQRDDAPERCFAKIHATLLDLFDHHISTTLAMAVLHPDGRVELYNCGTIGWFVAGGGKTRHLPLRSSFLGAGGDYNVARETLTLEPGERLFTFSDGCLEGGRAKRRLLRELARAQEGGDFDDLFRLVVACGVGDVQDDDKTMVAISAA